MALKNAPVRITACKAMDKAGVSSGSCRDSEEVQLTALACLLLTLCYPLVLLALEGPSLPGLAGSQTAKDLSVSEPFICKPTNPEPISPAPPLLGSQTQSHCSPALITPAPGTGNLREPQCPRTSEMTQTSQSEACFPCLTHSFPQEPQ